MKIRKATIKDLDKMEEIHLEGNMNEGKLQFSGKKLKEFLLDFKKSKKKRRKDFKKNIRSSLTHLIVVEEDKEVVCFGFAIVHKDNKKFGETRLIYVKKEFRGKGIGTKVKRELLRWLKSKKVKYANTRIYSKNKLSIKLSKKFGFKEVSVWLQKDL